MGDDFIRPRYEPECRQAPTAELSNLIRPAYETVPRAGYNSLDKSTSYAPRKPRHRPRTLPLEGRREGRLERRQVGCRVAAQAEAQHRQAGGSECLGIALGLGIDEPAEGVGPARDLEIVGMLLRQLEEPADRRTALVELARRVEEAWPVAGRRGPAGPVPDQGAEPAEGRVARSGSGR